MPDKKWILEYRPHKKGLAQVLGDTESDILEMIWAAGPASVRTVHDKLNQEREVAYTTVLTVMRRLNAKKILQRQKNGKSYTYFPTLTKEEFAQAIVTKVLDGLLDEFSALTIDYLAQRINKEHPRDQEG